MSDDKAKTGVIDPKTFWRVLGERAVGVPVVTAQGSEGPAGLLALSATHLSADPPIMLVSIDKRTSALAAVMEGKHFAISYLARSDQAIADTFGGKTDLKGAARFEAGRWRTLKTGAPVLASALGAFDCVLEDMIDRGGTFIAVGRVVDATATGAGEPLVFFRGKYMVRPGAGAD